MSDYRHVDPEDDEYDETDHWGEDPIFSSIEEINTQIEEMKNLMSESNKTKYFVLRQYDEVCSERGLRNS